MNSDDEGSVDIDSGNETSDDDNVDFEMVLDKNTKDKQNEFDDYPYEVLSTEQIVQHMIDSIMEVNAILQFPPTTTRILLNHFKWDKEKLMERLYDSDQDAVFAEARVVNPFRKPSTPKPKQQKRSSGSEECLICYMILPSSCMTGLECNHKFCTHCWTEYLSNKIMEEGLGQTIACAAYMCDILVDDATVMRLVKDTKVRIKYQHIITNSFVQCNRLLRWCPSPDCTNAIKVQSVEARPVTCNCLHTFCFQCGENWHEPVKCHLLKRWIKKCDDDSETSNWIAANTKECPKCNVTIEKDGGCNHMVCKNQNCKADFCWVCLGPWEPHGSSWYNCNRYDEKEAKAARDAQERSRAALQRYLFYCNRYMNHMQSLKFEHKLYASVKNKMEEMQHHMSWIEDNQRDLESATEVLSEYLERDITSENLLDIKQKVQDKFRYCDGRRKVLLEHVHEGYDKDWWVYND